MLAMREWRLRKVKLPVKFLKQVNDRARIQIQAAHSKSPAVNLHFLLSLTALRSAGIFHTVALGFN